MELLGDLRTYHLSNLRSVNSGFAMYHYVALYTVILPLLVWAPQSVASHSTT
ncbi:hypothetical protein BYT27DRAFT_6727902 [Phlegmacium glaucopus]|nr:hypothetical protein BYT27DRAFT_6727902 [Phlegmacium glaucopus]